MFLTSDPTVRSNSVIAISSEYSQIKPQFENVMYTGQLKQDLSITVDPIRSVNPTSFMRYEISEASHDVFDFVETAGQIEITLKTDVTEDEVKNVPSFTIALSVYLVSDSTIRGTSVITINSEFIQDSLEIPNFDKILYTGRLKDDMTLVVDPIAIVNPTDEMEFKIVEGICLFSN